MSEPRSKARKVEMVVPGLLHWSVDDERIGWRSDAYALATPDGLVLIDPLPLTERALDSLGTVCAICLTIQSHTRSAWRYRRRFAAPVFAPRGAEGLEEKPDSQYGPRAHLPGGMRAVHTPGPCEASYALLAERVEQPGFLFIGDLLMRGTRGPLRFVPDEYQDDPLGTRISVRRLLRLPVQVLCPGHGAPLRTGAVQALRQALDEDAGAARPGAGA